MINGGIRTKGITKTSTTEKPVISVITVVFNGEETLEQTILSVVNQSYDNLEYIIVDGGSKDGTLDILKKYEDKIDYWQSEPDKGVYDAMNKGIRLATGDYIYIIGCDDWLVDNNTISGIIPYLIGGYDVISGKVWLVYQNGFQKQIYNNLNSSKEEDIRLCNISSPHQGMFVKRTVMEKNPFDSNYKIAADFKSLLTLWYDQSISIKKIDYLVAYYSNEGMSGKTAYLRKEENKKIIKEMNLANTNWGKYVGIKKSFIRCIKDIIIHLRLKKFVNYLLIIFDLFRKRIHKHQCSWNFCRYCNKKLLP